MGSHEREKHQKPAPRLFHIQVDGGNHVLNVVGQGIPHKFQVYPGQPSSSFVWSETCKSRERNHSQNTLKVTIVMRSVVVLGFPAKTGNIAQAKSGGKVNVN
jgi:hypothetical protein